MDAGGIDQRHFVQFTKLVVNSPVILFSLQHPFLNVNRHYLPDVTVEDFLIVVVHHLDNFVTRREGGAEADDAGLAVLVERLLQLRVQGAGAESSPVHGRKHLDIPDRVQAKALRDTLGHNVEKFVVDFLRGIGRDEVEVGQLRSFGLEGHLPLVDAVGIDDDARRSRLPEYFGELNRGYPAGVDNIGKNSPRSHG